ncbi:MAG: hypothetical protein FGM24_07795 [Candidatus Kapabacteria bacterium]|nr:hypothetical protein [Candidatus Kapabacteria bacterium]
MSSLVRSVIIAVAALLACCVPAPVPPDGGNTFTAEPGGVWVLCEGLWRQNDSELWFASATGATGDVVQLMNPEAPLGDTGSDILRRGDTLFVAINGSRCIDVIHAVSGRRITRILLDGRKEPYRLALADDSTLYCSNLNDDSITEIDARTLDVRLLHVPVGPAPEGIAASSSIVAVANSGLGDLRRTEEGAGSVYIYRRFDMLRTHVIDGLINVASIRIDQPRNTMWVTYRHLPSQPDSLGGLVAFDLASYAERGRWRVAAPRALEIDRSTGDAYVLHADGIDVVATGALRRVAWHRSQGDSVWYSLGIDPRGSLWVGDAKSYRTPGDVIVLDRSGHEVRRMRVGRNPTAFAFP